ncbi:hypothetical protein GSI_12630 [Ganoderma sinense ZZ0214-1]|uniref:BTB domain-containing protein n=1 Tax=Ganoderma sinense ZZ0214-1 TaxID=1077348 RepID=A0A2G8RTD5_9APHY|nr:hypothetical protein GSI_12630 [Ganoderma sinense ZZ0214-1]
MFKLPQPAEDALFGSPDRPVVHVAEDSNALEPLLLLCYPVHKPLLQHLDKIQPALEAGIKFDMKWPTEELTARFLTCTAQDPFRVWAFGCRHGLEYVARRGAEALRESLPEGEREKIAFLPNMTRNLDELDGITAGQYFRLLQFIRASTGPRGGDDSVAISGANSSSATRTVGPVGSLEAHEVSDGMALLTPPKAAATPVAAEASVVANRRAFKKLPFADVKGLGYPGFCEEDVPSPDIICRCEDGTEFKTHQTILSLYSPVLRVEIATINAARASARPSQPLVQEVLSTASALPVLEMGGSSDAVSTLLGICHRAQTTLVDRQGRCSLDCIRLLSVATRYKIQPAIDLASAKWGTLVPTNPHYCYFLARKMGMRGAAAVAATSALRRSWRPDEWPSFVRSGMEDTPARAYHQLSVYVDACSRGAVQAVEAAAKAWQLIAAERSTVVERADAEAVSRMYQTVTDKLDCRREALDSRGLKVGPNADHASILQWSLYGSVVAGPPSLKNRFKEDLESVSARLRLEIDNATSKVKLDLR